ncbi:MAG: membrane protein insertion efficiency factor YidD [Holophagaceae bacterium]|uniref:Putative membrane protein insertion efficiency factor n=1 Tax=Candidatus Geothrix skivensis TaxID=2954439 RepID=A0A9D7SCS8_9BACT|nr:membrane protein insertion efficiency factor YidD [Candidatus Geothrix skivensis]
MRPRPRAVDWLLAHPLAAIGLLLLLEACLPVRFQPTAWVCRGAIRLYQVTLSSHLPTQCKYTPTCSHYGLACIQKFGTLRGGLLTTWRLIRCSPLTNGGIDPVP